MIHRQYGWGDTGRYPLGLSTIKQTINYYHRVQNLVNHSSLVYKAFLEQKNLQLDWYRSLQSIHDAFYYTPLTSQGHRACPSTLITNNMKLRFAKLWEDEKQRQSKLSFYNDFKCNFIFEKYLEIRNPKHRSALTKLRTSAHQLEIETGRYKNLDSLDRFCKYCEENQNDDELPTLCLPFYRPIHIGDESHFLIDCPILSNLRAKLPTNLQSALLNKDYSNIFNDLGMSTRLGRFVHEAFEVRKKWLAPTLCNVS